MTQCKQCGKMIDELEVFSGQICIDCYEANFDQLSEEEKKPDFTKTLNIKKNEK